MSVEQATEYGRLVTIKNGIVSVDRIRLYDGHRYNWHSQLIRNGILFTPTDQTYDLSASCHVSVSFYDEIWFEGVRIYKKPLWRKILSLLD